MGGARVCTIYYDYKTGVTGDYSVMSGFNGELKTCEKLQILKI